MCNGCYPELISAAGLSGEAAASGIRIARELKFCWSSILLALKQPGRLFTLN